MGHIHWIVGYIPRLHGLWECHRGHSASDKYMALPIPSHSSFLVCPDLRVCLFVCLLVTSECGSSRECLPFQFNFIKFLSFLNLLFCGAT